MTDRPGMLRVTGGSGRIVVRAVDGADLAVDGQARVARTDRFVDVVSGGGPLSITVPTGTDVAIGATSGRVTVVGPMGHVSVIGVSGRVEVEQAASVDIRTETSRVEVGRVAGPCCIRSASGKVEVASCGGADVSSTSGRVELRHVDGAVDVHSVSGRIELSLDRPYDVRAETVSGRIDVSLPRGTVAFRPDGPADRSVPPPDASCTVSARSETGKVVVTAR